MIMEWCLVLGSSETTKICKGCMKWNTLMLNKIKITEFKWETKGNTDICNNKIDNSARWILKNMAESKSTNRGILKFDHNDCVFESQ